MTKEKSVLGRGLASILGSNSSFIKSKTNINTKNSSDSFEKKMRYLSHKSA